tara:strand:- start:5595 stop:9152 length:3558 start_codon:yes stop_codon:yes gene_type:complete
VETVRFKKRPVNVDPINTGAAVGTALQRTGARLAEAENAAARAKITTEAEVAASKARIAIRGEELERTKIRLAGTEEEAALKIAAQEIAVDVANKQNRYKRELGINVDEAYTSLSKFEGSPEDALKAYQDSLDNGWSQLKLLDPEDQETLGLYYQNQIGGDNRFVQAKIAGLREEQTLRDLEKALSSRKNVLNDQVEQGGISAFVTNAQWLYETIQTAATSSEATMAASELDQSAVQQANLAIERKDYGLAHRIINLASNGIKSKDGNIIAFGLTADSINRLRDGVVIARSSDNRFRIGEEIRINQLTPGYNPEAEVNKIKRLHSNGVLINADATTLIREATRVVETAKGQKERRTRDYALGLDIPFRGAFDIGEYDEDIFFSTIDERLFNNAGISLPGSDASNEDLIIASQILLTENRMTSPAMMEQLATRALIPEETPIEILEHMLEVTGMYRANPAQFAQFTKRLSNSSKNLWDSIRSVYGRSQSTAETEDHQIPVSKRDLRVAATKAKDSSGQLLGDQEGNEAKAVSNFRDAIYDDDKKLRKSVADKIGREVSLQTGQAHYVEGGSDDVWYGPDSVWNFFGDTPLDNPVLTRIILKIAEDNVTPNVQIDRLLEDSVAQALQDQSIAPNALMRDGNSDSLTVPNGAAAKNFYGSHTSNPFVSQPVLVGNKNHTDDLIYSVNQIQIASNLLPTAVSNGNSSAEDIKILGFVNALATAAQNSALGGNPVPGTAGPDQFHQNADVRYIMMGGQPVANRDVFFNGVDDFYAYLKKDYGDNLPSPDVLQLLFADGPLTVEKIVRATALWTGERKGRIRTAVNLAALGRENDAPNSYGVNPYGQVVGIPLDKATKQSVGPAQITLLPDQMRSSGELFSQDEDGNFVALYAGLSAAGYITPSMSDDQKTKIHNMKRAQGMVGTLWQEFILDRPGIGKAYINAMTALVNVGASRGGTAALSSDAEFLIDPEEELEKMIKEAESQQEIGKIHEPVLTQESNESVYGTVKEATDEELVAQLNATASTRINEIDSNKVGQGGALQKASEVLARAGVEVKEGVVVNNFTPETTNAVLQTCQTIKSFFGKGSPCVLTSGYRRLEEAKTSEYEYQRTLHVTGNAFDIRARHLSSEQKEQLVSSLRKTLGNDYDIVWEPYDHDGGGNHIHIERDTKETKAHLDELIEGYALHGADVT